MRLFHVTPLVAMPSIGEQGLLPRIGERATLLGEKVPAVYCFDSREAVHDGLTNWMAEALDDDLVVILELDATGLTIERAASDFEVRILERVAPHRILTVFDENWNAVVTRRGHQVS